MSTTTAAAIGGLLGTAAALIAARLAQRNAHRPLGRPARMRAVLVVSAALFGALAAARHDLSTATTALVALAPAAAAAVVDGYERRLPDPLTTAVTTIVAAQVVLLAILGIGAALRAACALAATVMVCLLAKALLPGSIGWGDVKLAPGLAALLAVHGWSTLFDGLLAWSGLVLVAALANAVRPSPRAIVAYGPALVAGTAVAILI